MSNIVVDPEESTVEDSTKKEETQEVLEPIEQELKEAQESDEFRGMDFNKLKESYEHLEKRMSQQGQELGELRQLSDTLIKQPKEEIDFFENPDEAVNQAIEGNERIRSVEAKTIQMAEMYAKSELTRRHPDYEKIDKSPEFAKWVQNSKARQTLYRDASTNLDVDQADELIEMFKESKSVQSVETEKLEGERKETLKAVKSDSGSTGGTTTKKIFRRADLMNLQIQDSERYNDMQDEILEAYAEGRVR